MGGINGVSPQGRARRASAPDVNSSASRLPVNSVRNSSNKLFIGQHIDTHLAGRAALAAEHRPQTLMGSQAFRQAQVEQALDITLPALGVSPEAIAMLRNKLASAPATIARQNVELILLGLHSSGQPTDGNDPLRQRLASCASTLVKMVDKYPLTGRTPLGVCSSKNPKAYKMFLQLQGNAVAYANTNIHLQQLAEHVQDYFASHSDDLPEAATLFTARLTNLDNMHAISAGSDFNSVMDRIICIEQLLHLLNDWVNSITAPVADPSVAPPPQSPASAAPGGPLPPQAPDAQPPVIHIHIGNITIDKSTTDNSIIDKSTHKNINNIRRVRNNRAANAQRHVGATATATATANVADRTNPPGAGDAANNRRITGQTNTGGTVIGREFGVQTDAEDTVNPHEFGVQTDTVGTEDSDPIGDQTDTHVPDGSNETNQTDKKNAVAELQRMFEPPLPQFGRSAPTGSHSRISPPVVMRAAVITPVNGVTAGYATATPAGPTRPASPVSPVPMDGYIGGPGSSRPVSYQPRTSGTQQHFNRWPPNPKSPAATPVADGPIMPEQRQPQRKTPVMTVSALPDPSQTIPQVPMPPVMPKSTLPPVTVRDSAPSAMKKKSSPPVTAEITPSPVAMETSALGVKNTSSDKADPQRVMTTRPGKPSSLYNGKKYSVTEYRRIINSVGASNALPAFVGPSKK